MSAPLPPVSFQLGFHKPIIRHDHGFLDDGNGNIDPSKKREPTLLDYSSYSQWCEIGLLALADLPLIDATTAYNHFLYKNGETKTFDYNNFTNSSTVDAMMRKVYRDVNGITVLQSALQDTQVNAQKFIYQKMSKPWKDERIIFSMCSEAIHVGSFNPKDFRPGYPYPDTENWQKAIGAHWIWLEAQIEAHIVPTQSVADVDIKLTIHAEDMYNFNPGNKDMATGIADAANGRFEECGLAHEFLHIGTGHYTDTFKAGLFTQITPSPVGG